MSRLLCHGHNSLLLSSYLYDMSSYLFVFLRTIKRTESFSCCTCGTWIAGSKSPLSGLSCNWAFPRCAIFGTISIFNHWSRPWSVARLSAEFLRVLLLWKGSGVPPPTTDSKIRRLQLVYENKFFGLEKLWASVEARAKLNQEGCNFLNNMGFLEEVYIEICRVFK